VTPLRSIGQDSEAMEQELREECARRYGVASAIHDDDFLWQFVKGHANFPRLEDALNYYFDDGARSAQKLHDVVARNLSRESREGGFDLLEFAAGYGMVTRHLPRALPDATILSCDIHDRAVGFIESELGGAAIGSEHRPEDLQLPQQYDVVFALSFFSHLPQSSFGRWLKALFAAVKPGGLFIFTTHGLASVQNFGAIVVPDNGFWYSPGSEQQDLDGAEYGSAITTPDFVITELFHQLRAPIAEFRHAFWWNHQDMYVVTK
jgi:SAM-dependent methyltransferase